MAAFAEILKRCVARLPESWQLELRRIHYRRAIERGQFSPDEPEDAILESLVAKGDWVVDVGANIGHYSKRFSELVGPDGRVFAFEPVPDTFSLLAYNARYFPYQNLTLLNVAASDRSGETGFRVPELQSGMKNYYMASIDEHSDALRVMALPLDGFSFQQRISLVKIDVEGHELQVLQGMESIIRRDHPVLIVETRSPDIERRLEQDGYSVRRLAGSPNIVAEVQPLRPANSAAIDPRVDSTFMGSEHG